ncbi:MAG: permease [Candidatus Omnitrophota bacterium]
MPRDPICGMEVKAGDAIKVKKAGIEYSFCSTHCKDKFLKEQALAASAVCYPSVKKPFYKNRLFIITAITIFLLISSQLFDFLIPFRENFIIYLKLVWWAVLLGLFLGGVVDYYIPREYISKVLSRRKPSTIFNSVLLGFLMSACSHGILALSIQLHKKGASNPAVVSFLMASPWANFAITILLFGFFGLKAIFLVISAIVIAINTGFIFMFLEKRNLIEINHNTVEVSEDFSIKRDIQGRMRDYKFSLSNLHADLKGIVKGALALSDMVLWWIIIGIVIASIAGAYIPVHFFHKFMGPSLLGLIVTLILATIIEVCSEGSSPLSFEIYRQTGAFGNSFVFLMAGVATDYTEIGLIWTNIGRRTALWLPVVTVPQIVLVGYIANIIFR